MMAADGKYYMTQAADLEGIFRIIESIPSPKGVSGSPGHEYRENLI
jgi:hypothetical protein